MKHLISVLVSIIAIAMVQPTYAFNNESNSASHSLELLKGLKARVRENDPSVEKTFSQLDQFFTVNPDEKGKAHFLNIKAYYFILKQDYVSAYEALLLARKRANAIDNATALAESYVANTTRKSKFSVALTQSTLV